MSIVNNGYKRAESIIITKYINGVPQTPIKYWIINAFGSFSIVTSDIYQTMSGLDFFTRRDAFILYISNIETGIIISKDQFEIYDITSCPITVPTTTSYVPTTTSYVPTTTAYIATTTSYVPTTTSYTPTTTEYIPTTTTLLSVCDPSSLYDWTAIGDGTYYRDVISSPTPPSAPLTLASVPTYSGHSMLGTRLINNTFATLLSFPSNSLWENLSTTNGPFNRNAIWTTTYSGGTGSTKVMTPLDKWLGFSVCLTGLTASKTYYVGIAADNDYRLVLDNVELLNTNPNAITTDSFQFWNIFPIIPGAGNHILELYGLNRSSGSLPNLAAFGCEIYDNTLEELTGATTLGDLNIIFTATDQTQATVVQNLDGTYDSLGYVCSSGSVYSLCDGNCIQKIYCP